MSINRPHDTFFKQLMGDVEVLRDFLGIVLPEDILEHLELGNLEIIDKERHVSKAYFTSNFLSW